MRILIIEIPIFILLRVFVLFSRTTFIDFVAQFIRNEMLVNFVKNGTKNNVSYISSTLIYSEHVKVFL